MWRGGPRGGGADPQDGGQDGAECRAGGGHGSNTCIALKLLLGYQSSTASKIFLFRMANLLGEIC